jgi:hypothetical protein
MDIVVTLWNNRLLVLKKSSLRNFPDVEVCPLIAELHNKISAESNNLERSEDKLTGDFFGTLRYLPFEIGMKPILLPVRFKEKRFHKNG